MKLDALKYGLTTSAVCALALFGCDPAPSGDDGASAGTGSADDGDDGDDGDDDGNTDTDGGDADESAGDDSPADTAGESDDGPVGMGEDPPVFECPDGEGETLVDKFFTIDSGEFNEVEKLDGVTVIDGGVDINRSNYNNLDFLRCITHITGDLTIFGNDFLVDVSALNNLQLLDGDFVFTENNAITVFDGMNQIDQIHRSDNPECEEDPCGGAGQPPLEIYHSIVMNKNGALEGIEGWEKLEFIFGNITIRDNPVLTHIDGFRGIKGIGLTLAITHNPELCMSSVNAVGAGIVSPAPDEIPDSWTTQANNEGC